MLDKGKTGSINTRIHLLMSNMLGDPRQLDPFGSC